jgi:hypothetical protein
MSLSSFSSLGFSLFLSFITINLSLSFLFSASRYHSHSFQFLSLFIYTNLSLSLSDTHTHTHSHTHQNNIFAFTLFLTNSLTLSFYPTKILCLSLFSLSFSGSFVHSLSFYSFDIFCPLAFLNSV